MKADIIAYGLIICGLIALVVIYRNSFEDYRYKLTQCQDDVSVLQATVDSCYDEGKPMSFTRYKGGGWRL